MDILQIKAAIYLSVAFLNFLMTLLIWFRGKTKATFYMGWTAFFSSIYVSSYGLLYAFANHPDLLLSLVRMTWSGVLTLPFLIIFIYYFTEQLKGLKIHLFLLFLALSGIILTVLALTTSLFVATAFIENNIGGGTYGPLEPLGRAYVIFCLVFGLTVLIKYYLKIAGIKKVQVRYFILGIGIYSFISLVVGGIMPLIIKGDMIVNLAIEMSSLFSLVWIGLTAYAILRYNFMDIRVVLGRISIYVLTGAILIGVTLLTGFFNNLLFKFPIDVLLILNSIIILLIFLPLFHFFERVAGKYFYYTFYSLQKSLQELSQKLNQIIELDKLVTLINKSLSKAFQLDKVAIILKYPATGVSSGFLKTEGSQGFNKDDLSVLLIKQDGFLPQYLQRTKQLLVREEIPYILKEKTEEEARKLNLLSSDGNIMRIGIFLPCLIKEELIGIIFLGDKLSREPYTIQEMNLLSILISQIAIALSNALSYQEIKERKNELERFYALTVGRELKMVELKKEIEKLKEKLEK